jgi:acyl-CoA thioesterase-1
MLARLALFCLALSPFVCEAASAPLRILPLGDSLTAGAYIVNGVFKTDAGYRFALWKKLTASGENISFIGSKQDGPADFPDRNHEGHTGRRIDEVTINALPEIKIANADIVLLMIGTNDVIQNHDPSHATGRLENLVEEVEKYNPNAKILISTIIPNGKPNVQKRVLQYNKDLTQWVRNRQESDVHLHLVDMYKDAHLENGLDGKPSDLIDGTHPTPTGYEAMGNIWYNSIAQMQRSELSDATKAHEKVHSSLKRTLNPTTLQKNCAE